MSDPAVATATREANANAAKAEAEVRLVEALTRKANAEADYWQAKAGGKV